MLKKKFQFITQLSLMMVFLVIIAGSVVRTTGSGMGCPDWPKCFGYYIPPTNVDQVTWHSDQAYQKGQMIVYDEVLKKANQDFISTQEFNKTHWDNYTKHDYALFNATHTWIEYINRLLGALSGIPVFLMFLVSFLFWKENKHVTIYSTLTLINLGLVAWLGKLVVDGNLIPNQITIHMLGALSLVVLVILAHQSSLKKPRREVTKLQRALQLGLIGFMLFQVILGTNVREEVDLLNATGFIRSTWVENLPWKFKFHRSFAILITLCLAIQYYLARKQKNTSPLMFWIFLMLGIEVLCGIVLIYADFPKFMQPVHLIAGSILFALQVTLLIRHKSLR